MSLSSSAMARQPGSCTATNRALMARRREISAIASLNVMGRLLCGDPICNPLTGPLVLIVQVCDLVLVVQVAAVRAGRVPQRSQQRPPRIPPLTEERFRTRDSVRRPIFPEREGFVRGP